jgi:sterol desaturase/sphingolipid hydroxylase (fatty acid hydroxylase superfamily)
VVQYPEGPSGAGGIVDIFNIKALLIAFLIFVPLERLFSLHADQKIFRAGWPNDLLYALLNGGLIKAGLIGLVLGSMTLFGWIMPESGKVAVSSQPLWLQLIEIIVVADIGFYFAHRAFHHFPVLWRFHSIHHGIEELDWLAAHRVHPIDQMFTKAASFVPIFVLGFSEPAIGLFALIFHAHALLIHANTRIGFGPLKWLIASPQFHHWHHANERAAYDKNFAGQLSVLDAIFGTLHLPDLKMPKKYGIDEPLPRWYLQQLLHPFLRGKRRRDESAPAE